MNNLIGLYINQLNFLHSQLESSLVTLERSPSPATRLFFLTDQVFTISSYLLASYSAWGVLDTQYTFFCDLAFELDEFLCQTHRDISQLKSLLATFDSQIITELHQVNNKTAFLSSNKVTTKEFENVT